MWLAGYAYWQIFGSAWFALLYMKELLCIGDTGKVVLHRGGTLLKCAASRVN